MRRVALASCATLPDADPDERLVIGPLRALGVEAIPAVWDDPAVDWASFDLTIIRSTWDYTPQRDVFLGWAQRVQNIFNPADVIAWNTDKHYLADLAAAGFPVVPTTWLEPRRNSRPARRGSARAQAFSRCGIGRRRALRHALDARG